MLWGHIRYNMFYKFYFVLGVPLVSVVVHHSSDFDIGSIDQSLKSLQRKIQREAMLREIKARRYHEKPSEKRKRKREESERRRKKINRKMRSDVNYRSFVLFTDVSNVAPRVEEGEQKTSL